MSKVKIAISGIGAVGGYYGGSLAAYYENDNDVDIFFISRGKNLEAIKENGLQIKKSYRRSLPVRRLAIDNPAEIGPVTTCSCVRRVTTSKIT